MIPVDPNFNPLDPRHIPPQAFIYNGFRFEDGTLAVEMNSGNTKGWMKVRTIGSKSLTPKGRVNRDGIGAVLSFIRWTPLSRQFFD
ncbi:MAG: hypothetical protein ACRDGA_04085, partial [Bacteroidota bacterium]